MDCWTRFWRLGFREKPLGYQVILVLIVFCILLSATVRVYTSASRPHSPSASLIESTNRDTDEDVGEDLNTESESKSGTEGELAAPPPAMSNDMPLRTEPLLLAESNSTREGSNGDIPLQDRDDPKMNAVVKVSMGRVRKSPSLQSKIKFLLPIGSIVRVVKESAGWYYVRSEDGQDGWGHISLFDAAELQTERIPQAPHDLQKGPSLFPSEGKAQSSANRIRLVKSQRGN
jgi:hypothetical protein